MKKLQDDTRPTTSPSLYLNSDIKNGKDGLYVALRVTDRSLYGGMVTVGDGTLGTSTGTLAGKLGYYYYFV